MVLPMHGWTEVSGFYSLRFSGAFPSFPNHVLRLFLSWLWVKLERNLNLYSFPNLLLKIEVGGVDASPNDTFSKFIDWCNMNPYFISFYCQIIFRYMTLPFCPLSIHHLVAICIVFTCLWITLFVNDAYESWLYECSYSFMMSMWTYVLISLGYMPRSGLAGSYGNSVHLKYYQIIFQSISTVLHSYQ